MASREELLNSIQPGMKLTKNFFMRIYGYELTWPGFKEEALSKLECAGCSLAREYYQRFVSEYEEAHEKEMKNVAAWYVKQEFGKKKGDDSSWEKTQEAEQVKEGLRKKSDRELLNLLQNMS